jgi:(1->4)-alpha-D-glucan 1-alpha-D-glucosylmutase
VSPPPYPRATMRLQLHAGFGFRDAAALVPYMAALGVSHLYASPFLQARPGSPHGYDITDHNALNPELGTEGDFEALVAALHGHDMGLILDFVPNHMGVGGADNLWWLDVLRWGPASPYAGFFDIDWVGSARGPRGKVLLPFLGDHYGAVLEAGELQLRLDRTEGGFSVWYHQHRFPIFPGHYGRILEAAAQALGEGGEELRDLGARLARTGRQPRSRAARTRQRNQVAALEGELAELCAASPAMAEAIDHATLVLNGEPGRPESFRDLHRLLEQQHYRIAYWRVAADEINYRRFFDINDLAGIRVERPEVFEATHRLVLRLLAEGSLQGIRLDHVDGLSDPVAYFRRLQREAAKVLPPARGELPQRLYLLVEKILARHERLREDWPVAGTTGYEFMSLVLGLFVDPAAEEALTQTYHRFIEREVDFEDLVVEAKRQILAGNLASELEVLVHAMHRLARQSWRTRDHTPNGLRAALAEVIAHFPVYRTYVTPEGISDDDRRDLDWAFAHARRAAALADPSVFAFLDGVVSMDLARERGQGYRRPDVIATATRFQQLTGPAMAKSVEDTAFYRYHRLVALNEVGGEPTRFGTSPSAFHHLARERQRRWPLSMLATATHDHKRGEDVRARLAALSELPDDWRKGVARWSRLNRFRKLVEDDGRPTPGRNDEYLLYQTLVGAWPLDLGPEDPDGLAGLAERIVAYMIKATREAKQRSSWAAPNAAYEERLEAFVREILDPGRSQAFLADLHAFQARIAPIGALNGLAQTLLKLTGPGVPDIYQGTEHWDLSLVDPDNRRPVDFAARERSLAAKAGPAALLASWQDGRVKQQVVARTLALRRERPALFARGDYVALEPTGEAAEHVVTFARRRGLDWLVTVVPRLMGAWLGGAESPLPPRAAWADTALAGMPAGPARELMTGRSVTLEGGIAVADLLADFPVALLAPGETASAVRRSHRVRG